MPLDTLMPDMSRLVDFKRGLVNRRIFSDEQIYRMEIERIFRRCWIYLAHESQIPNPGDFVSVEIAADSILVCRTNDGEIKAFINSCRHRGNKVCRADRGNAKGFVCSYHGWSYNVDGRLVNIPGAKELYHDQIDQPNWGLPELARLDSYKGLIFGTFDAEAPSLEDYLGDVRWGLDLLLDQGDLVAAPGTVRWTMDCNWKFAADNAIGDSYHGAFTHRSAALAGHRSGTGTATKKNLNPADREGFTAIVEYGHGYNAEFYDESAVDWSSPLAAWRRDPAIQSKLGPVRSKVLRANFNIFPNLFVNSGSRDLMVRNPLGPTKIEIWKTTLVDRNAPPDVQRMQVRASNRHFGPGGMFEQDDGENWVQSTDATRGAATQDYDLNYQMGLGRAVPVDSNEGPLRFNGTVNEHGQRWLYRCWAEYMEASDWVEMKKNHSRPSEHI